MTFRATGMHCPACEFLVADELGLDPAVAACRARWTEGLVEVDLAPDQADDGVALGRWNARLAPLGYRLFAPGQDPGRVTRSETWAGVALGALVLTVFGAIQALGLVNLWAPDSLGPGGAFVLGLLASVSSCFALVGGLLVSWTAAVGRTRPRALGPGLVTFHLSRLGVFALGGGLLGLVGEALGTDPGLQKVLLTLAALVMALLGANLLGLPLGLPGLGRTVGGAKKAAGAASVAGAGLLGAATFVLPCGFTQSVQFQALASGTFADGALLTTAFALGTLPVLASAGWFLGRGLTGARRAVLLKAGGTLVLGLGLFQLWGALHLWGFRLL